MQDLQAQILAAINISDAMAIVVAAGLALIGLAFAAFVLRQGSAAANGQIGQSEDDDEDKDD